MNCLECNEELTGQWTKKFCNKSHAAKYNNKKYPKRTKSKTKIKRKSNTECSECSNKIYRRPNEIKRNIKFLCSSCVIKRQSMAGTIKSKKTYESFINMWKNKEITGNTNSGYKISKHIRKYLFDKYDNSCSKCGWGETNVFTGNIPLEVEHIDGNSENSYEENLTLLCPNCHSLTSSYKGANKGNGRHYRRERYKNKESY